MDKIGKKELYTSLNCIEKLKLFLFDENLSYGKIICYIILIVGTYYGTFFMGLWLGILDTLLSYGHLLFAVTFNYYALLKLKIHQRKITKNKSKRI